MIRRFCSIAFALITFYTSHLYADNSASNHTPPFSSNTLSQNALTTLIKSVNANEIDQAFLILSKQWHISYVASLLDIASIPRNAYIQRKVMELLTEKTGKDFGYNTNEWYFWLWNQTEKNTANYSNFKADLYRQIDPRFERYFRDRQANTTIRLDEVRWGGVRQDGIPPLRQPNMIKANQADYLADTDIVFGIELNGDVRAYPKRILAWHEMFVDTIGGVEIAGVYCTLCGTVIPYKTQFKGVNYQLGTSGFLYRSNKLMYDKATQSLWSTVKGTPVVGPLVDQGIQLEYVSIVTTTWGEWKRRNPTTKVLSLQTGHNRDYGEGVAYRQYFASDRLMFNTPFKDNRLNNKQEVLALTFPGAPSEQLAIDTDFLRKQPLYTDRIGRQKLLILTDKTGANRVYDPKDIEFVSYDEDSTLIDANGQKWHMTESHLQAKEQTKKLNRLPQRHAFWFGWYAAYPETRLVK